MRWARRRGKQRAKRRPNALSIREVVTVRTKKTPRRESAPGSVIWPQNLQLDCIIRGARAPKVRGAHTGRVRSKVNSRIVNSVTLSSPGDRAAERGDSVKRQQIFLRGNSGIRHAALGQRPACAEDSGRSTRSRRRPAICSRGESRQGTVMGFCRSLVSGGSSDAAHADEISVVMIIDSTAVLSHDYLVLSGIAARSASSVPIRRT